MLYYKGKQKGGNMKNTDVMKHFIKGTECSTELLYSDGADLYYKDQKVGETLSSGKRIIYDYSGGNGHWIDTSLGNIMRAALNQGVPLMNKNNKFLRKKLDKIH